MTTCALLVMTDGRKECIEKTIPSALEMLHGPIIQRFIYDDSGDYKYRSWLMDNFPTFQLICEPKRQGFGGAIQAAWRIVKTAKTDYVFHLEDDFLFNEPISLVPMIEVLNNNPHLYQMALRRQAWSSEEKQMGGVIERYPNAYMQKESWMEHRLFFTTNPGLYRTSLIDIGWPDGEQSEGIFTRKILDLDPYAQFGYWGQKTDPPLVHHIGDTRIGINY